MCKLDSTHLYMNIYRYGKTMGIHKKLNEMKICVDNKAGPQHRKSEKRHSMRHNSFVDKFKR